MASAGSGPPLVSIIIPVRNEEAYLARVLDDISRQTLPGGKYEVIVVDGMSTDGTLRIAREFASVFPTYQLRENAKRLASAARNIGFLASQGEYIIFIDGHCQIESSTMLEDMLCLFAEKDADILCRPQPLTAEPMTPFQQAVALARSSQLGHGLDSTIYSTEEMEVEAASSGAMYRREVFRRIGSFDERFDACEDVEFNTRADRVGLKALISPKLTVKYAARKNLKGLWNQLLRYGVGRFRLMAKHPGSVSPGTLAPPLLALCWPLLIFWWLIWPLIGLVLTVLLSFYLALVVVTSLVLAKRHDLSLFLKLLPIFLTIHLALGVGFLLGPFRMLRR